MELGFGNPGGWQDGDFNFDGAIDLADVKAFYDNWGQSAPVSAPLLALSVPEPGAGMLLGCVAAGSLLCGRRRRVA